MTIDPTNRNTALASAFADELARSGVRHAVICPGSRSTPLALAIDRASGIEAIVVIDERSAGFIGLGMAAASEAPVVVLTTSGTAAANLHPAVCEADESGLPLVVLSADRPPELRGIGAGQTIDQIKLFGSAVRWFCEVGSHDADDAGLLHYRSVACRAVAHSGDRSNPGPVHLNFAWRDPLAPVADDSVVAETELAREGRSEGRPLTAVTPRPLAPAADVIEPAASYISGVERGVILAGRQRDPGLASALAALAGATGFPVLAEPTSQARTPAAGERLVWAYEWIARLAPAALRPELILRFGEFPTSKALRGWLAGAGIEQMAFSERGWNDPASQASAMIRGGPAATAEALAAAIESRGDSGWADRWQQAQDAAARAIADAVPSGLSEPALHGALGEAYRGAEIVYTASSMPVRDQEAFLPPVDASPLFFANRGANGIDGLVSSGIGAAIASGQPAWIVTGDLGFVHDSNALLSLAAAPSPMRIVVVNNSGGGIFEHLPQAELLGRDEFERLFITPAGVDFVALCAAHGIGYQRLETVDQLREAPAGSCVIEVPTDGRADAALRATIAERTRDALVDALSITG